MQDARKNFPPVVYVPTTSLPDEDGQIRLETTRTNDGRTALFVYSALDRLHDFYAPESAWALLTVDDLQAAYDAEPYDLLFLDRRPRPAEVAAG
jgi:hypothetical protein